jgi:2',3'-cyclic-nucleotide 2'-phosphodiesterase (5'-nucleotidase family)
MKSIRRFLPLFILFLIIACHPSRQIIPGLGDGILEVTFLQMNDVYEISPSSGDNLGGLARVASIQRSLKLKNPNTITVLSGDFISPSVTGTLKYEGKRIRGKQMVETLNSVGVEYVVFGNHEFDYDQEDLQARLDESSFTWFGANCRLKAADGTLQPFFKNRNGQKEACPDNKVITVQDADGTTLHIGLFGVLLTTGVKPWVQYTDWMETAKKNYEDLKTKSDVVVAITHLAAEDDKKLSAALPEIPLIMGGHDHENMIYKIGKATLAKADANAKTVYIHTLRYDKRNKTATVKSELIKISGDFAPELNTAAVVAKWEKIKTDALSTSGFDAYKKVTDLKTPLDCRETIVRNQQAPVGKIINDAMISACKTKPDCSFFNSGSVRVDDILSGTVTEIDVVRMLPFGGSIYEADFKGSLLRKTLDTGLRNKSIGGYLQWGMISHDDAKNTWMINGQPLDDQKTYHLAISDYLLTGSEQNLGFLKAAPNPDGKGTTNPEILSIQKPTASDKTDLRNDIRLAVIKFWRG